MRSQSGSANNKDAHLDGKTEKCKLNRFPAAVVDAAIDAKLHELRTDPEVLKLTLEKSLAELKADLATVSLKVKPLEERRARIRRQIDGYNALVTVGELDADDYLKKVEPLKKEEKNLERQEKVIDPNLNRDIEFKKEQIATFESNLDQLFNPHDEPGDVIPPDIQALNLPETLYDVKQGIRTMTYFARTSLKYWSEHPDECGRMDTVEGLGTLLPFMLALNGNPETGDDLTVILNNVEGDKKAADVTLRFGKTLKHSINR
jgi:hypothetical protein